MMMEENLRKIHFHYYNNKMIIIIIKDNHISHNNLQFKTKIYKQRIK